ncbi:UNVERIFIED_CONTAM: hypothetical protein HDU68_011757 [Siphonaria sp. JEL0065]|nr:hypothetical protein HDU68_011757 [Siphonaria sp. JEL0065]
MVFETSKPFSLLERLTKPAGVPSTTSTSDNESEPNMFMQHLGSSVHDEIHDGSDNSSATDNIWKIEATDQTTDLWNPESVSPKRKYQTLDPPSSAAKSPIVDKKKKRVKIVPLVVKDSRDSEAVGSEDSDDVRSVNLLTGHVVALQNAFASIANIFGSLINEELISLSTVPQVETVVVKRPKVPSDKAKKEYKKTGYIVFRVTKAVELRARGVKTSVKELAEMWTALSQEEKQEYIDIAKEGGRPFGIKLEE